MSSKPRGDVKKEVAEEEVLLPPCTVKPQVLNGSRRALPNMMTPCATIPELVTDSDRPLAQEVPPQVLNGSRRPIPGHYIPELDTSLPSFVGRESLDTISTTDTTTLTTLETVSYDTFYFPSPPIDLLSQSPIYLYSPFTYPASYPSIPLWTPPPTGSHSSPVIRSSTTSSIRRTSIYKTFSRQTSFLSTPTSPSHHALCSHRHSSSQRISSSHHRSTTHRHLSSSRSTFHSHYTAPPRPRAPNPPSPPTTAATQQPPPLTTVTEHPAWSPAEDALLRSLVHVSKHGSNASEPPLSWMEIAERMQAHVERYGLLGPNERVYHTNKLARRWGRILEGDVGRGAGVREDGGGM